MSNYRTVHVPLALVIFGKTFNYQAEAVLSLEEDRKYHIKSCTGTCKETGEMLELLSFMKDNTELFKHVAECIQENWNNKSSHTDELAQLRDKRKGTTE